MKVLDLFSGLGGFSQAFKDRGHDVFTIDIETSFKPDLVQDILEIEPSYITTKYDCILASPPCNFTSQSSCYNYFGPTGEPRNGKGRMAIKLFKHTKHIMETLDPKFWIIENPRCLTRKFLGPPQATITYCQYGQYNMKPTDLWGKLPKSFVARKCKNGATCHNSAPRGSFTGNQGSGTSAERAKIPYKLSFELCRAMEVEL